MPTKRAANAIAAFCFTLLLTPGSASATAEMRPGNWEFTLINEMPGMPISAPPMSSVHCITAEAAADPKKAIEEMNQANDNTDCRVTDYKTSGNRVQWTMQCDGSQSMRAQGESIFESSDAWHGTSNMTLVQDGVSMTMTQTTRARRIGDCK